MDNNPADVGRRSFLVHASVGGAALLTGLSALEGCGSATPFSHIRGGITGANHQLGHRLRNIPDLLKRPIRQQLTTDVLIVGGGVAGLSARRWLHKQGVANVLLLEMAAQTGGNAAYGQNDVSAYPLGAHYLPIPDLRQTELLDFLRDARVITGTSEQQLPIYEDYYLCHDPEERLFINGFWQEGLVPDAGVAEEDRRQIQRFFARVEELKAAKGADGRDAFVIPLDESSADAQYRQLDSISFADYLVREGFTSPYLTEYLTYCCRDDYGTTPATTSAWAGLHYFAARKGQAANAHATSVLTWPQGNGFLADHLRQQAGSPVRASMLVFDVHVQETAVQVRAYDVASDQVVQVNARRVIMATPHFITHQLLQAAAPGYALGQAFAYAPWMVASLTVTGLPQGRGFPLCWDNVLYGTTSVGYINNNQQDLKDNPRKVITYYRPLTEQDPAKARQMAYQTPYETWLSQLLDELERAHPGVTSYVEQADVWVWGHAMIAPSPGFIWGVARQQAAKPLGHQVFFAHSDLSGISIFEEAFYQGIRAAREVVSSL